MSQENDQLDDSSDPEFETVQLYPPWRNAISVADLTPGNLLTYQQLYTWFEVEQPGETTPYPVGEKARLQFFSQMTKFQEALLRERQVALQNVVGLGYRIVYAREQSQWGYEEFIKDLKRSFRKGRERIVYTNLTELTPGERQQHADYLAKISAIGVKVLRRTRAIEPPEEQER